MAVLSDLIQLAGCTNSGDSAMPILKKLWHALGINGLWRAGERLDRWEAGKRGGLMDSAEAQMLHDHDLSEMAGE